MSKNPFNHISIDDGYDLQIQDDGIGLAQSLNTGFQLMRSTEQTIAFYAKVYETTQSTTMQDQKAYNYVMANFFGGSGFSFKWRFLDRMKFPNGWVLSNYPPARRPSSPVIVHMNWITGHDSKVHRLRENIYWLIDPPTYYNFAGRLFVTYSNNDPSVRSLEQQTELLINAMELAWVTKRTLILPRFRTFGWAPLPDVHHCTFETLYEVDEGTCSASGPHRHHHRATHSFVPAVVNDALRELLPDLWHDFFREHAFLRNPVMTQANSPIKDALLVDLSRCRHNPNAVTEYPTPESAFDADDSTGVTFSGARASLENDGPIDELQVIDKLVRPYEEHALWVLPRLHGHFVGARNPSFRERLRKALRLRTAPNLRAPPLPPSDAHSKPPAAATPATPATQAPAATEVKAQSQPQATAASANKQETTSTVIELM